MTTRNISAGTGDILDFEDYRFIVARDGIEALRIYWRLGREIDLVLLDYFLPVMDGDAVFDELKAINPDVRSFSVVALGNRPGRWHAGARLCGFSSEALHAREIDRAHPIDPRCLTLSPHRNIRRKRNSPLASI